MSHPELAYIIEGQKCSEHIKIQQQGRIPTRRSQAITRSRGQQHGTEDDTPARDEDEDQDREQQGEHQDSTPSSATARSSQLVPATAAVPRSILWSIDSDIVNVEEIKHGIRTIGCCSI